MRKNARRKYHRADGIGRQAVNRRHRPEAARKCCRAGELLPLDPCSALVPARTAAGGARIQTNFSSRGRRTLVP